MMFSGIEEDIIYNEGKPGQRIREEGTKMNCKRMLMYKTLFFFSLSMISASIESVHTHTKNLQILPCAFSNSSHQIDLMYKKTVRKGQTQWAFCISTNTCELMSLKKGCTHSKYKSEGTIPLSQSHLAHIPNKAKPSAHYSLVSTVLTGY